MYIYSGLGVTTPDDIDGMDPEPVATVAVKRSATGEYTYKTISRRATITVAFTCQAKDDAPTTNDPIAFVKPTGASIAVV